MAFTLPTFNLVCNVWRGGNPTSNPPDVVSFCNLTPNRRVYFPMIEPAIDARFPVMFLTLLLPALTDVRMYNVVTGPDVVEVPAGSHRFYQVQQVDDVGKGFANEHRFALILPVVPWPQPIP
jgi:hypothetical protein